MHPLPPAWSHSVATKVSEIERTINHEINNIRAMKKLRQIVFILHDLVCSKDDNNGLKWKFAALDYVVSRCGYLHTDTQS